MDGSARPVYLDYQATTPVDPRVLAEMLPYFTAKFGNSSSIDHVYGADASDAVELARQRVATLVGASSEDVIFTSGATEANNLAILGLADGRTDDAGHIVTVKTEHRAVLDPCLLLEKKGWTVTRLAVDHTGLVDPDDVRRALRTDTRLVSIMAANNEIGTLAPLREIAQFTGEAGVPLHSDATQAAGYLSMDAADLGVDLVSVSAHKMYGPKGVGALVVRGRQLRRGLAPRQLGGGHERGLRSGTLNVPCIVGLGAASELAKVEMTSISSRLRRMRERLWSLLEESVPGIELNGHQHDRLPHNLNVYVPAVNSRALLVQLKGDLAMSTGAACGSAKAEPSHVIASLGLGENRGRCSVRMSLGRPTSEEDIEFAAVRFAEVVALLR